MSGFTARVHFTTEFDGDTVSMQLGRLSTRHIMQMMPHFEDALDSENKPGLKFALNSELEVSRVATEFLPEYVYDFSGLKDSDGNAVSLETAISAWYFNQLISSILRKLMEISKPSIEEADALGKPSVD